MRGYKELRPKWLKERRGFVLILVMLFLLFVTLFGISALNTATYDNRITGNKRASEQAFYVAEAGINEFMGRFREGATNQIIDSDPSNPTWKLLLAKGLGKGATRIGYVSGNPNSITSLQGQLDFGVEIKHKIDDLNHVIEYGGVPIYVLKSHGFTADGGNKVVEVELIKSPVYDPPSALYSEGPIHIQGSSIYINGNDVCGTIDKPGIITTATTIPPIMELGNPSIIGSPPQVTQVSIPPPSRLSIKEMLEYIRGESNFRYRYDENQTLSGYSDNWGTPTSNGPSVPIIYTGMMNIVFIDMQGTQTLKLAGGSHGAGILLVDGNLEVSEEFAWYGVILVTGTVDYTGGGDKNVTGGVIAGEIATIEEGVGGNVAILYCSAVSKKLKDIIPPVRITRWREIF
jgi:hypothetical protein